MNRAASEVWSGRRGNDLQHRLYGEVHLIQMLRNNGFLTHKMKPGLRFLEHTEKRPTRTATRVRHQANEVSKYKSVAFMRCRTGQYWIWGRGLVDQLVLSASWIQGS
jgi:hypothetical protein